MVRNKRLVVWLLSALLLSGAWSLSAQDAGTTAPTSDPGAQPAQAVSQTGLLPVYGVDFPFDPTWVDSSGFPSQSADHPNFGTNATFQQVWDTLRPAGLNCIRFAVDVRDPKAGANRVANLCVWAKNNSVNLVPVLTGADTGAAPGESLVANSTAFAKALASTMRADPQNLQAYSRILAFQIEDRLNHTGLHRAITPDAAQKLLQKAASAFRAAEQEALKDTGLYATPIMISASFDHELIRAKSMAGVQLTDASFDQACQSLKKFLGALGSSQDINIIALEWFPGCIGAGSVDKLPSLLRSMKSEFPGKQMLLVTGYSTAFNPSDQNQYCAAAFANLADYRVRESAEGAFLGVLFHKAMDTSEGNVDPPKPDLPTEMAAWDWAAKSQELSTMWSRSSVSPELAWWLGRTEGAMGMIELKSDPAAGTTLTPKPGHGALLQIAGVVSEANVEMASAGGAPPAAADPNAPPPVAGDAFGAPAVPGESLAGSVKSKMKEGLLGLIDKVFQKMGDKITAAGTGGGGGGEWSAGSPPPMDPGVPMGMTPDTMPPPAPAPAPGSIVLAAADVAFNPQSPKVGQQVNTGVTVHNQSPDTEASDLIVALVDANGFALDTGAQESGVKIGPNAQKKVNLAWTPSLPGPMPVSAEVYDAALTKLASVQVDLTVSDAPGPPADPGTQGGGGGSGGIECKKQDITVVPPTPKAYAPVKFKVNVRNSGQEDASGIDLLLIDTDADPSASLLAEVDGNNVAKNGEKKVDIDWTPAENKTVNLSVQVWQGYEKMLAEAKLDPISIAAAESGSEGSDPPDESGDDSVKPGGKIPLGPLKVKPGKFPPDPLIGKLHSTIPIGLPQVTEFALGEQTPMSGKTLPVIVGFVNPYSGPLADVTAKLLADGKLVGTKSLGTLLAGQNRSIIFSGAKLSGTGKHVFEVQLKGGSGKPLTGSAKCDITVSTRMLATSGALASGKALLPGSKSAGGYGDTTGNVPGVRSTLPPAFNIGGKVLVARAPTVAALPAIRPVVIPAVTPKPPAITPGGTGVSTITRPTIPVVTTTPTIPGITPAPPTVAGTARPVTPTPPIIPGVITPPVPPTTPVTRPTGTVIPSVTPTIKPPTTVGATTPGATIVPTLPKPTIPTTIRPTTIPGVTAPSTTATGSTPTVVKPGTVTTVTPPAGATTPIRTSPTVILVKPDLAVTTRDIRCSPSPAKAGEIMVFTISVRNLAAAVANGASVTCALRSDRSIVAQNVFTVNVASKGTASVQWRVKAPSVKSVLFEVVLSHPADSATANNRASATIGVSQ